MGRGWTVYSFWFQNICIGPQPQSTASSTIGGGGKSEVGLEEVGGKSSFDPSSLHWQHHGRPTTEKKEEKRIVVRILLQSLPNKILQIADQLVLLSSL